MKLSLSRPQCDDLFDKVFTVVVFEGEDSFREDIERGLESVRKKRRVLRRSGEAQYTKRQYVFNPLSVQP